MTDRRAYQREWQRRKRLKAGMTPRSQPAGCGTPAAYRRHRHNNERPCDACREAWNQYQRDRYRNRPRT